MHEFPFRLGRDAAGIAPAFHGARQAAPRRARPGRQCGADPARHRRIGPQFSRRPISPACCSARASCSTATRYYIILPDGIGHGTSSKPSDGLHARFPQYDYEDMVAAQYALATQGLQVDHLRLVIGTSMGCMHIVAVGGTLSRLHGCLDAARLPAGADCRTQPLVARPPHGRDPLRSAMAAGRIPQRAVGSAARRGRPAAHRRQRADPNADRAADPRCRR